MSKVKGPTIVRDRNSINGQFVNHQYAVQHPKTTERQHIHIQKPTRKGQRD